MNRRLIIGSVGAVIAAIAIVAITALWPRPVLPSAVRRQLTSVAILPSSDVAAINRETVQYDSGNKLLSFQVSYAGATLIVSEQPTPEQFTDIPETYKKVIDQMNNYLSFESELGTVHLTKPMQLAGLQTAVLNSKGTLLFIKPSHNLSDDQWKQFFRSLEVEH